MSAGLDPATAPSSVTVADLLLPAQSSQLAQARRYVRQVAIEHGLDADSSYELEYAVNEAVTNAIRHGRPDERGYIRLSACADSERLTITVHDYGTFAGRTPVAPAVDAESGRGLALMARFVDELKVGIEAGATTVGLSKLRL